MENPESLRFRKADLLAAALVVLLAVLTAVWFLPNENSGTGMAQVYQNGELVKTLPLDEDAVFTIAGKYSNTITVQAGTAAITESDCPGGDCVHSGAIRSAGRSIVCLPNAVEIRVVNAVSDVDFVVG